MSDLDLAITALEQRSHALHRERRHGGPSGECNQPPCDTDRGLIQHAREDRDERMQLALMTMVMFLIGGDRDMDAAVLDAQSAIKWLADPDVTIPEDFAYEVWEAVDDALAGRVKVTVGVAS